MLIVLMNELQYKYIIHRFSRIFIPLYTLLVIVQN